MRRPIIVLQGENALDACVSHPCVHFRRLFQGEYALDPVATLLCDLPYSWRPLFVATLLCGFPHSWRPLFVASHCCGISSLWRPLFVVFSLGGIFLLY